MGYQYFKIRVYPIEKPSPIQAENIYRRGASNPTANKRRAYAFETHFLTASPLRFSNPSLPATAVFFPSSLILPFLNRFLPPPPPFNYLLLFL
jgi:hypothetical protein